MKQVKKIMKGFVLALSAILIIGITVLGVHIYQVTGKADNTHMANVALGRIDFLDDLEKSKYVSVQSFLKEQHGVRHTYLNDDDGIIVFGYEVDQVEKNHLYNEVVQKFGLVGELYVVDAEQVANACPVVDRHSIMGRVSSGFQKLFAYLKF